jgi:hypothetical protein
LNAAKKALSSFVISSAKAWFSEKFFSDCAWDISVFPIIRNKRSVVILIMAGLADFIILFV